MANIGKTTAEQLENVGTKFDIEILNTNSLVQSGSIRVYLQHILTSPRVSAHRFRNPGKPA